MEQESLEQLRGQVTALQTVVDALVRQLSPAEAGRACIEVAMDRIKPPPPLDALSQAAAESRERLLVEYESLLSQVTRTR